MIVKDDALIQQAQLSELAEPTKFNLKTFRNWMAGKEQDFPLNGPDRNVWGEVGELNTTSENLKELAVTHKNLEHDSFTDFIVIKLIPLYHRVFGNKNMNGKPLKEYSKEITVRVTAGVATLCACLLPTVAIVILYTFKSMPTRLGVIGALTGAFSIALMTLTHATRVDIFTATAA